MNILFAYCFNGSFIDFQNTLKILSMQYGWTITIYHASQNDLNPDEGAKKAGKEVAEFYQNGRYNQLIIGDERIKLPSEEIDSLYMHDYSPIEKQLLEKLLEKMSAMRK